MIFDDDFTGATLSASEWSTGWFGSGITRGALPSDELECYDPAHAVVANGELDLNLTATPESCPYDGATLNEPYASGIVTTDGKFSFTYGYLEARVWLPGSGSTVTDWPAVWALGQSWPQDGELDVVEGLRGSACWHFHDPSGGPGGCAAGSYTGGWHTFAADWEPGSVTWYYDGVQEGALTSGVTSSPMYLVLDLALDSGVHGGPIQAPATMRVDYVRVWQH